MHIAIIYIDKINESRGAIINRDKRYKLPSSWRLLRKSLPWTADAIRTTKTAFFSLYCFTEYTPRNTWLTWLGYVTKTHCAHVHHEIEASVFPPFCYVRVFITPILFALAHAHTYARVTYAHATPTHTVCN